jgi:hypothetical protein
VVPSVAVTVPVSFKTTAAVEAAATDCAVVTHVALAGVTSNEGKKTKDNVTISAASRRRCLIWVLLPYLSSIVCFVLF